MTFDDLGLAEPLNRAVRLSGYSIPTPIQERAIPPALAGRDLLGCAQTGTGKTAAFTLPILQRLMSQPAAAPGQRRPIRTLILTPTRELAGQIGESVRTYGKFLPLTSTVIFGGVGQYPQEQALRRGVDIVIATPGRLLDLMQQRLVNLASVNTFVLDEADRMLDMGFIHDIRKIIAVLPRERQTLFFSATMPREIQELSSTILRDPLRIEVAPVSSAAETVSQSLYHVERGNKQALLEHLLGDPSVKRALVFTRTKHGADRVARSLNQASITCEAIHGNKSQNNRLRALKNFKVGAIRVLVASDIAARGLDIDEISHVFNFEIPNEPETYVHRIGRTGRAGASGRAISLCSSEERAFVRDIERLIRKPVDVVRDHPYTGASHRQPMHAPRQQQAHPHQRPARPEQPERNRNAGFAGRPTFKGRPGSNPPRW
jgi:ATP-dependent RNA helicase RhlE